MAKDKPAEVVRKRYRIDYGKDRVIRGPKDHDQECWVGANNRIWRAHNPPNSGKYCIDGKGKLVLYENHNEDTKFYVEDGWFYGPRYKKMPWFE